MKQCDILNVNNVFMISVYCVTECTIFNIVMIKKMVCITATVLQNGDGSFRRHYSRVLAAV
jgi:hypothetical protein